MATGRDAQAGSTAPDRGTLVLLALILVAAVANLNLAVANVALPSIGAAFDSSQTTLNLIAVGYSLGLAASVLYFGALGDRYGRKMMLIVGTALAIPASLLAAFAPTDTVLFLARVLGGLAAGMAYPDDARAHHGAVVRAGAHEVDRAVVGDRWRHLGARTAALRLAARALLVGLGLPRSRCRSRSSRSFLAAPTRSGPRERGDRPGRQPRRRPVGPAGRRAGPRRSTSRPCRTRRPSCSASRRSRSRPASRS